MHCIIYWLSLNSYGINKEIAVKRSSYSDFFLFCQLGYAY